MPTLSYITSHCDCEGAAASGADYGGVTLMLHVSAASLWRTEKCLFDGDMIVREEPNSSHPSALSKGRSLSMVSKGYLPGQVYRRMVHERLGSPELGQTPVSFTCSVLVVVQIFETRFLSVLPHDHVSVGRHLSPDILSAPVYSQDEHQHPSSIFLRFSGPIFSSACLLLFLIIPDVGRVLSSDTKPVARCQRVLYHSHDFTLSLLPCDLCSYHQVRTAVEAALFS